MITVLLICHYKSTKYLSIHIYVDLHEFYTALFVLTSNRSIYMGKMFQVYGVGQALFPVLPPPLPFENAPTVNQTNYEIGQLVFSPPRSPTEFYLYGGAGNWIQIASGGSGPIQSVVGTANQVTVADVAGVATVSLPAAITTPGSLATTTTLASGTTITSGTSITATLGNITATNGNFVKGTAGNKDVYTSVATTTAAGANSAGTVTLVGGTATVSTTSVTAASKIRLSRQGIGATGVSALGFLTIGTITAGTSFVINAVQAASATALQASDVSSIWWEIVN